jgi:hypothetical protein
MRSLYRGLFVHLDSLWRFSYLANSCSVAAMLARPPWQTAAIRPGAFKCLEVALDWLVDFLSLSGVLVVRLSG